MLKAYLVKIGLNHLLIDLDFRDALNYAIHNRGDSDFTISEMRVYDTKDHIKEYVIDIINLGWVEGVFDLERTQEIVKGCYVNGKFEIIKSDRESKYL